MFVQINLHAQIGIRMTILLAHDNRNNHNGYDNASTKKQKMSKKDLKEDCNPLANYN